MVSAVLTVYSQSMILFLIFSIPFFKKGKIEKAVDILYYIIRLILNFPFMFIIWVSGILELGLIECINTFLANKFRTNFWDIFIWLFLPVVINN